MARPVLYSANPWISQYFVTKYCDGTHFAWCSECFDPSREAATSAVALLAPSSSPAGIIRRLKADRAGEDVHSELVKRYRKTFKRLATQWLAAGLIREQDREDIVATLKSPSWRIWEPLLYVIPRDPIECAGRLVSVPHSERASMAPEYQIVDLASHEFDIITV